MRLRRRIRCWVNYVLSCEGDVPLLFTENETNHERLFPGQKNESPYVKDGINDCVVQGKHGAVNPGKQGTKVAAHYQGQDRCWSLGSDSPAALKEFSGPEAPTLRKAI